MADLSYFHGVKLDESADVPSLLRVSRFGIVFINGTAPDADEAAFPLNTPKLITAPSQASALGAAGTLSDDVATIFGEGGSWVVVNRVEHSETAAVLEANLIGDAIARTGLYSALRVKSLLSTSAATIQPRVIVTAGDTGTFIDDGTVSGALATQGSKMTEAPTVTASGGGTDAAKVLPTLQAVMGTGADADKVVSVKVLTPGRKMTVAPTLVFAGGGSDEDKVLPTATANLGDVANAYVSALAAICPHISAARIRPMMRPCVGATPSTAIVFSASIPKRSRMSPARRWSSRSLLSLPVSAPASSHLRKACRDRFRTRSFAPSTAWRAPSPIRMTRIT